MKISMPLPLFLAFRFLRASGQEKSISVMIKICFFSILIGTCALTLVAAIMKGFESATHKKLQGVHADVTINAYDKAINYEKLKKVITTEYANSIKGTSPTSISQVIIHNAHGGEYTICLLKAVDPAEEPAVSQLDTMITNFQNSSQQSLWPLLDKNSIALGQALADALHVTVGDTVTLLYPEDGQIGHKVSLEEKKVTVAAFFKTGIHDFDEHVIIASFDMARQLYPMPISQVSVTLIDPRQEQKVIESLKKRLSLDVISWKELYPSLVSALVLEKYAMLFMLALVALVASLTIISLLFMYVTHKRTQIAVLKTMGMSDWSLMSIFVLISAYITLFASLCGIGLAALITALLNKFPFIPLPDAYYVTHLPATLTIPIIAAIMILAICASFLAGFIPAYRIKSLRITEILKSNA